MMLVRASPHRLRRVSRPTLAAHQHRYASQISLNLSIKTPPGSEHVMYPFDQLELNRFNTAAQVSESPAFDGQREIALRTAREVVVDAQPGDGATFDGNRVWQLRRGSDDASLPCARRRRRARHLRLMRAPIHVDLPHPGMPAAQTLAHDHIPHAYP
jgi:hypothetical protein